MTQAITSLALVVPDYQAGLEFYVGVMGFDLLEDTDQGHKRWIRVAPKGGAGAALVLAQAEGPDQVGSVGNQTGGRVFLFLETDDFDRDYARMKTAGVFFEEEPRHEDYGWVVVWRDPFGNRWDLLERR